MSKGIEVKNSGNHTLFLPAFIDDYGFTPEEFRVFSRIMRRSLGTGDDCYESVPNLAKKLLMSERLVKRALKVLTECRAVVRVVRPGKTDLFDFNTLDKWKPSRELPAIRSAIDAETKAKDRIRKTVKKPLVGAETHGVTGCGNAPTVGAETQRVVGAETPYEGIPSEGIPIKGGEPPKPNGSTPKQTPPPSQPDLKPKESYALALYGEYFPDEQLTPYQLGLLKKKEVDAAVWRKTLGLWRGNGSKAKNLGDLFDRYEKELARGTPAHKSVPTVATTASDIDRMEAEAMNRIGLAK